MPEYVDKSDLQPGVMYDIKFSDCCVHGRFSARFSRYELDKYDDKDAVFETLDGTEIRIGSTGSRGWEAKVTK